MTLVPITGLFIYVAFRKRQKALERFGNLELVQRLCSGLSQRRRTFKAAVLLTGLSLLLLALARPQFGTRVETVTRAGQDIIIALDVSTSMLAEDIRPNRLEKAKREIASMIDRLEGDRIGLVAFAGEAFVTCPLTLDYGAARMFLSAMDPDLIPLPGTALAEAVRKARSAFVEAETKNKVLIIITDGEDHDGSLEEAVKGTAEDGIVIFTIGVGTPRGVPIPVYDESDRSQSFKRDPNGEVILTRLDEETLRMIADVSGGSYHRSTSRGIELEAIYDSVSMMEKKELSARQVTVFDERFQPFLALGLLLILIETLTGDVKRTRKEWRGRFQ
jgi:Ca-activated chloride channel family protein